MYSLILLFHILAATIWTGGHLVLATTVLPRALKARSPEILLSFENGFEKIGMPALVIQIASGLWLAYQQVPEVAEWFSFSDFAVTMIALKLGALALTAGFAISARFFIVPNLRPETLRLFAWHIVSVTLLSVLFVVFGVGIHTGGY